MTSPYERSKKWLESSGWIVGKTEMPWNTYTKVRHDLFNLFDAIAINGDSILGLQVTSENKGHEHLVKALGIKATAVWLRSNGRFEIHDWRCLMQDRADGKRGKRPKWEPKVIQLVWNERSQQVEVK